MEKAPEGGYIQQNNTRSAMKRPKKMKHFAMPVLAIILLSALTELRAQPSTLFPQIYDVEPSKKFVDLGPVLFRVRPSKGQKISKNDLYVAARRLHADGLVKESRSFEEVYLVNMRKNAKWSKNRLLTAAVDTAVLTTMLLTGLWLWPDKAHPTAVHEERVYYRAIKFVDKTLPPVKIQTKNLSPELRTLFAKADSMQEQAQIANAAFGTGVLSPSDYQKIRQAFVHAIEI